ncbi:MAG TPA: SRPBCC family protein [Dermatophilaceae bacterium]|nr:SRPBCC family protein [Dermatophilaceae bacterium]
MARISGQVRIAAPVEWVFDTVVDSRNEPSFNPVMTSVELLTEPPIGVGTRFRAVADEGTTMLVELTEVDRPRSWAGLRTHLETRGGQPPG